VAHRVLYAPAMRTTRAIWLTAALAASLPACGGGGGGDYADDAAGDDTGDDGGNVGFGGAQDIGQFRSILDAGEIPGEETLDAGGFFNEHFTELPPPDCGQTLCLEPMISIGRNWMTGAYQATVQVAMTTPVDASELPRLPLNLVVIVDHSGSMAQDERMAKVRQGLHLLIDELQPGDRLALVQFDDTVDVLASLADEPNAAALHAIVDGIVPRGATNIHGGLQAGFELAAAAYSAERQNRVLLLSDGLATAGELDSSVMIALAESYVSDGMSLSTVGVGLEFDVALMRGLAEHGSGNFYFAEDAAAVEEIFTDELATSLTPLALDIVLHAIPAGGYHITEVVGTRAWTTTSDGGQIRIPAAFLATREDTSPDPNGGRRGGGGSLYLDLGGQVIDPTLEVATLSLSYRMPGSEEIIEQVVQLTAEGAPEEVPPTPEETFVSLTAMLQHYAVYNIYLGLRLATRYAVDNYDCSYAVLEALREASLHFNTSFENPDILADVELFDQFMANLVAHGARPEAQVTQGSCASGDPYPDDDYGDDDDTTDEAYGGYGCASAGRGATGAATLGLVGLALIAVRRRRAR
jgi:Ca-activated chloride channel family protein